MPDSYAERLESSFIGVRAMTAEDAETRAQRVYDDINARTSSYNDFGLDQVEQSRRFFDLATPDLRTRPFDVLTTLAGLPAPIGLQQALTRELARILECLPAGTRVYRVRPELLHWESHIVRRPGEPEPPLSLAEVADRFATAVADVRSFKIEYRGFFIAPDGTVAFQGYGPTGKLRRALGEALPFSSPRQNQTGHISIARILDSVGDDHFRGSRHRCRWSGASFLGVSRAFGF